jgi:MarR family transcriptional regulator, transcriptional regulator for hemolysin
MVRARREPPNPGKSHFRLGFLVHDVSRLRRTVADKALKPLAITRSQFWLLSNLERHDGASMKQTELAELLDVGKVAIGGLLDRLEAVGAIKRTGDKIDRRAKRIKMTPTGAALLDRAKRYAVSINEEMMEGVTEAEIAMAEDILHRMKIQLLAMDGKLNEAARRHTLEMRYASQVADSQNV